MDFTHHQSFLGRLAQAAALVASLAVFAANAQDKPSAPAEPDPDSVVARYPSGTIQSVDVANKALQDVEAQRNALDKKYATEQQECNTKFFATNCLDAAKERHRVGTEKVHNVEVEANAFIRSDRVVQRDKNLAEKRANEAANPPKPLADLPIKNSSQQNDADRAKDHQQRIADHDAKMKQLQQNQANDASQRAANVAAYNKKVEDAKARQADVAKKKEEKAKQAAAKAASAAASKTGTPVGTSGASASDSSSNATPKQ